MASYSGEVSALLNLVIEQSGHLIIDYPIAIDFSLDVKRISIEIPTGFTEMLSNATDLALEWRMTTRELFTTYFAGGCRAIDFVLDREARKGTYLLTCK